MGVPRDVITTPVLRHHLTCGSSNTVSLTRGPRSTVNVDRSTVNTGRVRAEPVGLRVGPGRAGHVASCDAATSRTWACTGPWSLAVGMGVAHSGPRGVGPWTAEWFTVDRVHPSPPKRGPGTPGARAGGRRGGGVVPLFLPRRCSCRGDLH
jgi:hypothetical protein